MNDVQRERLVAIATDTIRSAQAADDFAPIGRAVVDTILAVLSEEQASDERVERAAKAIRNIEAELLGRRDHGRR